MGLLAKLRRPTAPNTSGLDESPDGSVGDFEKRDASPEQNDSDVQPIDPELEKRVVRKLDMNLMPLVFVLYLLAFLDRSNIGNARIAGMDKDLNLYGDRYDWFLTIFYISYTVFEPTIVFFKLFRPSYWMAFNVFGWGLVATVQAGVPTWGGEMALRFLMGVFEAAYGPGVVYLLSFFYLRHEIGFRQGLFLSAAPLATTFAGALAYGITSGHAAIASWRLLFLVEGLPTICMAPIAFFFCPDSPSTARFFTEEEKKVALARTIRQNGTADRRGGLSLKDSLKTLLDIKPWLTAIMYFSANVSFSSLPVFLPTIITDMGFNRTQSQGLSAPPYFLAFLATLLTTWIADKTQQRGLMVILMAIIGGVGYVILATAKNVGARYFAVYMAATGVFPVIANILPWTLNNSGSDTRRGIAVVMLNVIGQCGPLLGTRVYPTSDSPYYVKGQAVCAGFMFFTALLALALRFVCQWENKKLDEKYGVVNGPSADGPAGSNAKRADEGEGAAQENFGPKFRYVL